MSSNYPFGIFSQGQRRRDDWKSNNSEFIQRGLCKQTYTLCRCKCTYHIITGWIEGICPTHIHCSLIELVQGSNVVSAFPLQSDPAEIMWRSDLCYFTHINANVWHFSKRNTDLINFRVHAVRMSALCNWPIHLQQQSCQSMQGRCVTTLQQGSWAQACLPSCIIFYFCMRVLPQSKNRHIRWVGNSKLSLCV